MEGSRIYQNTSSIKQDAALDIVGTLGALIEDRKKIEIEVCAFDTWEDKCEYVPLEAGQHYVFNVCPDHKPLQRIMNGESPADVHGFDVNNNIVHEFHLG